MTLRCLVAASMAFLLLSLWHLGIYHTPSLVHAVRSSFDWSTATIHHSHYLTTTLPTGPPKAFPAIQHSFDRLSVSFVFQLNHRRDAVRQSFSKCWESYHDLAWMQDELLPISSSSSSNNNYGGWAATLVDSLDTLWIMGLEDDFHAAARAVATID
jgi:mannosyl-oligosaccharide alpha-1,2-mannosidase